MRAVVRLWADFAADYDAQGNVARLGLNFSGTPRNRIDSNAIGPGRLKLPYLRVPGANDDQPWTHYRDSFVEAKK